MSAIAWIVSVVGMILFIGGLFLYGWLARHDRPPRPTKPYREWGQNDE